MSDQVFINKSKSYVVEVEYEVASRRVTRTVNGHIVPDCCRPDSYVSEVDYIGREYRRVRLVMLGIGGVLR